MVRLLTLGAVLATVACGGGSHLTTTQGDSDDTGDGDAAVLDDPTDEQSCAYVVSGSSSDSGSCALNVTFDGTNGAIFQLNGVGDQDLSAFIFQTILATSTQPALGSYTTESVVAAEAQASIGVDIWALYDNIADFTAQGSFTLSITSLSGVTTIGTSSSWSEVHGSLDVTLEPSGESAATGEVTAHADF